jgi:ribose transport system substrate-binding protein
MQTRISLLALICASVCAISCNRSTQKRIVFVPKGRAHVFWQSVHAGAIAAMRENPGYEIIWNGPAAETDFDGQIQIVEAAINQQVDAICLAPIDKKVLVAAVDRAASRNIPVIIFDSPVDSDKFTAQVATDNYAGGALGASRMGQILAGRGRIAEVAVQPGSASTMAREQGFEETLAKDFPGIRIVDKQYGMADFGQSLKVAENMLTAAPDMNGMFASNESSTVGAVRALKDKTSVKLVGFDSSPQLAEALKNGVVDSLIVQDPFQMGYKSMIAAVTKLKGGSPERIQNIAPALVTRENMNTPEIQKKINPDLDKYLK